MTQIKVKSQFVSFLLTIFLGPFGLFYSDLDMAIVMTFGWFLSMYLTFGSIDLDLLYLLLLTGKFLNGWVLLIYLASPIVGIFMVKKYNKIATKKFEKAVKLAINNELQKSNTTMKTNEFNNSKVVYSKEFCVNCGKKRPAFRVPKDLHEALWGGYTCSACGAKMKSNGELRDDIIQESELV